MKIFDYFMYFNEDVVLNVRLNFLDKFVDKFVKIKSEYDHNVEGTTSLFNIDKFGKFKDKKYSWWRVDTFFSKKKYNNILFVEEDGWHFSYLKSPKDIEKKLKSYLHHIDYDLNPVGEKGIQEMINNRKTIYNIKADQKENKFDGSNKLNKININLLPSYIFENKHKLKDWIRE
jgi:hypothetical protein